MKNSNEHQNNESQHTTTGSNKKILSWFGGTLLVLLAVVFVIFMVMNRDPTITGSAVRDVNIGSTSTIVPSVADTSKDNPVFFATPASRPSIISTNPISAARNVPTSRDISVTFNQAMDSRTVNEDTFTLRKESGALVNGRVTSNSAGRVWTFTPVNTLSSNTVYIATINTGARDVSGNSLSSDYVWNFKTRSSGSSGGGGGGSPTTTTTVLSVSGQSGVNLGLASNFVILSKAGISTTGTTHITGDIGVSPIDSTAITGFGLIMDSSNTFATSSLVTGKVYAADYTAPTPTKMTTAISDMETAYTNAAGRTNPTATELGAGDISGLTIAPGLYKWGTGVLINNGVTLSGGANDVWIFQIAQDLTMGNGAIVTLSGGAQAKNIFWQVAGQVTLGTTSQFKGNILTQTLIDMQTGATLKGRALAQTAVTLDANAVTI